MTIEELKDFFTNSSYSEETKNRINTILSTKEELTKGVFAEIKDILQEELNNDYKDIDVSGESEAEEIKKEYEDTLNKIEEDLDKDMQFIEGELKELDELQTKITEVSEQNAIEQIKNSIQE